MKSIDERAEEFASVYPKKYQHFAEECYIMGATDQKSIDDEEYRKDMRYIGVKREELIDKAKKAFCKSTCKGYQDIGRCLCDGHCDNFNQFVKLLEE